MEAPRSGSPVATPLSDGEQLRIETVTARDFLTLLLSRDRLERSTLGGRSQHSLRDRAKGVIYVTSAEELLSASSA